MIKKVFLLIIVFTFSLHISMGAIDPYNKEQIEIYLCGTKEKPQLKWVRGKIELFSLSFQRYEVAKGIFIVEYEILFPKMFKVKIDNNVTGLNTFGRPIKIVTNGFLSLDQSSSDPRYFLQLVSFSFQDNTSAVEYNFDLLVPQKTYSQYYVKQVSSNTYLLQRKAEINPRLISSLSYRFGTDSDFFLSVIPDDFECIVSWTENGATLSYEKILYFPW